MEKWKKYDESESRTRKYIYKYRFVSSKMLNYYSKKVGRILPTSVEFNTVTSFPPGNDINVIRFDLLSFAAVIIWYFEAEETWSCPRFSRKEEAIKFDSIHHAIKL